MAQWIEHQIPVLRVGGSSPFRRAMKTSLPIGNEVFQLNPPFRVGEIVFDDEITFSDEIRLDGGRVDLISSA